MYQKIIRFPIEIQRRRTKNYNNNKIVEYDLQLHAHNAGGFVTWIILNNLPCDKHIVDNIENGKVIISSRVFNVYLYNGGKQLRQYLVFRCGMTH